MSKKPRRSIDHDPGADTTTRIRSARGKKSRAWEKKHNPAVASYRLTVELKQAIRDLADELGVSPAVVAEKFLETGLKLHKEGKIKFE